MRRALAREKAQRRRHLQFRLTRVAHGSFLPDKAIDLVDEAAAKLKMEITSKPVVRAQALPAAAQRKGAFAHLELGAHA